MRQVKSGQSKWGQVKWGESKCDPRGDTKKEPEACEGLRSTQGGGFKWRLLGGEIAARETDEAEDTGAEEGQRERLWNSGRGD